MDVIGDGFSNVLSRAAAGSSDDFAVLYRDINPGLMRYLGVVAQEQAEDVAGETWLAVVKNLASFSGDENSFRSWMFTIARHKLIDVQRKTARRPTTELTAEHDRTGPNAEDTSDVVAEAMSTERALALIAELPTDQAEAVMLRVVAGLDVAQVAAIMERSPGAVRVLSHRGLKRLAQRLSIEGFSDEEGSDE
jgi:RNA polymerase sigma-70 factor (ECF subfamily)